MTSTQDIARVFAQVCRRFPLLNLPASDSATFGRRQQGASLK
jgi:hypothetical protein